MVLYKNIFWISSFRILRKGILFIKMKNIQNITQNKTYSELSQISKMEIFTEIVNGYLNEL